MTQPIHPEPTRAADKLKNSVRRAGGCGPLYRVLSVLNDTAEIELLESQERATLPVSAALEDPLDR